MGSGLTFYPIRSLRGVDAFAPGLYDARTRRTATFLPRRQPMLDILYLGLIVGFLAISWGLVELCDRL
jgi:hypothetical protein